MAALARRIGSPSVSQQSNLVSATVTRPACGPGRPGPRLTPSLGGGCRRSADTSRQSGGGRSLAYQPGGLLALWMVRLLGQKTHSASGPRRAKHKGHYRAGVADSAFGDHERQTCPHTSWQVQGAESDPLFPWILDRLPEPSPSISTVREMIVSRWNGLLADTGV